MMSCPAAPAGRDAWATASTMTGSNLAVSGKAAWFGHQYRRESSVGWSGPGHRPMRNSLSPGLKSRGVSQTDVGRIPAWREGAVQDRADGGRSFSYSLPRLRIAGSLTYTDERGKPTAVDVSGSGWADRQWGDFPADQGW